MLMHALFLAGLIAPFAISLAIIIRLGREMKDFVADMPALQTVEHLNCFKRLVARNMYGALAQIVLFLIPWVVYVFGLNYRALLQGEVAIIFALSIATFIANLRMKKDEEAVRHLPVEDPDLRAERDRVVETWMRKVLPDW